MTVDEAIEKIKTEYRVDNLSTNDDVSKVLSIVAKPGEEQEVKREVVQKLFQARSPQGMTTADFIHQYPEF